MPVVRAPWRLLPWRPRHILAQIWKLLTARNDHLTCHLHNYSRKKYHPTTIVSHRLRHCRFRSYTIYIIYIYLSSSFPCSNPPSPIPRSRCHDQLQPLGLSRPGGARGTRKAWSTQELELSCLGGWYRQENGFVWCVFSFSSGWFQESVGNFFLIKRTMDVFHGVFFSETSGNNLMLRNQWDSQQSRNIMGIQPANCSD